MRILIIGILAAMSLIPAAHAADIATKATPRPVYETPSWQGFYVGAQAAYGRSGEAVSIAGNDNIASTLISVGVIPGSLNPQADGWLGGAHVGYNWQFGNIVTGIEASFEFSGVDGSAAQSLTLGPVGFPLGISTTVRSELEWLGTVTARVGTVIGDRLLVFGRGGLAYGDVSYTVTHSLAAPAPFGRDVVGSFSDTRFGWTVGAGAEYAINPRWTARITYDYVDLGSGDAVHGTAFGPLAIGFTAAQDFTLHKVGGGVSYRF